MIRQYLIIGLVVLAAVVWTAVRLIRFFQAPVSKCEGCSGCALEELKAKKKVTG
jgi:hypothetical protein